MLALAVILGIVMAAGALVLARTLSGDARANRLVGTNGPDRISGRGGPDRIIGRKGRDRIRGGRGPDVLRGGKGRDKLRGGRGRDILIGGPGRDVLRGGAGPDLINMKADGAEVAARGNDLIRARDGASDQISCGAGRDRAIVDRVEDGVYDCEEVIAPGG
jgi:Ca2+-binding RTX toxin-like protein